MARASERMGLMSADAVGLAAMIGGMFWGFGAWWAVAAVIVILRGYDRLPFALSWWGFTFPLAAWTIAGLQISEAVGSAALLAIAVSGAVLLVVVWAVTLVRTIVGVANRSIWAG
jgi:tellurite resistance protein TehA-like permease